MASRDPATQDSLRVGIVVHRLPFTKPYTGGKLCAAKATSSLSVMANRFTPGGVGPCTGRSSMVTAI